MVALALYVAKFTPATDWGGVSQSLIFHQVRRTLRVAVVGVVRCPQFADSILTECGTILPRHPWHLVAASYSRADVAGASPATQLTSCRGKPGLGADVTGAASPILVQTWKV